MCVYICINTSDIIFTYMCDLVIYRYTDFVIPCQAEFLTRVVRVRERMSSKEQEVTGKWLTEEKMKADYAPYPGLQKSIYIYISDCQCLG